MKDKKDNVSPVNKPKKTADITLRLAKIPLKQLYGKGSLDKLHLRSDTINSAFVKKYSEGRVYDKQKEQFKMSYSCYYEGMRFQVYENPFDKISERYKIALNPRLLTGYSQFKDLMEVLEVSNAARISRFDVSVFLNKTYFSIEELFLTIRPLQKRWLGKFFRNNCREHLGHITGFDFGKWPNRISSYYRGLNTEKRMISRSGQYLNFEIQISKNACGKLGIENLGDLKKVTTIDPFRRIKFYDIWNVNSAKNDRERQRWSHFQDLCQKYGIYNARTRLRKEEGRSNLNVNYDRCFEPLLVSDQQLPMEIFLLKSFRRSMKLWFRS